MHKRAFIASLLITLAMLSPGVALSAQDNHWHFNVSLDGKPIGQHSFKLTAKNYRQMLSSEADFLVKFLFLNAYYYEHKSTEYWDGDCLQKIESATVDNGERYRVSGQLGAGGFRINRDDSDFMLPDCIMTFAYWNPKILNQKRLLNSQTGEYMAVDIAFRGRENLIRNGRSIPANRYDLESKQLRISLWYDVDSGQWLALESLTDNDHVLRYELIDHRSVQTLSQMLYD